MKYTVRFLTQEAEIKRTVRTAKLEHQLMYECLSAMRYCAMGVELEHADSEIDCGTVQVCGVTVELHSYV